MQQQRPEARRRGGGRERAVTAALRRASGCCVLRMGPRSGSGCPGVSGAWRRGFEPRAGRVASGSAGSRSSEVSGFPGTSLALGVRGLTLPSISLANRRLKLSVMSPQSANPKEGRSGAGQGSKS